MGITHFDKVCGVNGVYYGAAGLEERMASITYLKEAFAVADFTDGGGASGTYALTKTLPAGSIPLGWAFVCTGPFTGDVSAVIKVGIATDDDRFSADTTGSVFAAGTVGSLALVADACKGIAGEVTVLVTVTTDTTFADCQTDDKGAGTLYLFYGRLVV